MVSGDASVTDGGRLVTPKRVTLDVATQLLRPPLLVGATVLSVASYAPGPEGNVPSHVVRVDGAHVVDIVNLKARILSIAEGEGARWALTQNLSTTGGRLPDVFLKRITGAGEPASSNSRTTPIPSGRLPRSGARCGYRCATACYQFDVNGERCATSRSLTPTPAGWRRSASSPQSPTATRSGASIPDRRQSDTTASGPRSSGSGRRLRGTRAAARRGRRHDNARVAGASRAERPVRVTAVLPDGFTPTGLAASTTRISATGTVDGAPAIALLDDDGVQATVVLENAGAVRRSSGPARARSVPCRGGELYEITLP